MNDPNNIIKIILDNESHRKKLKISEDNERHFDCNKNAYLEMYGSDNLWILINDALAKNQYIEKLEFDNVSTPTKMVFAMPSLKKMKSIYIPYHSYAILKYANTNEHNLEKLNVFLFMNERIIEFLKIPHTCKKLKKLTVEFGDTDKVEGINKVVFDTLNETDITKLHLTLRTDLFICDFIKKNTTIKYMHIKYSSRLINDDLINSISQNYTLLRFTSSDKYDHRITNIMERNKKYITTIYLCINKKIVPRLLFKNIILKYIFDRT